MVKLLISLELIITANHLNINRKKAGQADDYSKKSVEVVLPLKYISNFGELLKCL